MGIDLLDISFRVERTFGIRMSRQDFQSVFSAGTVGSLYAYLLYRLDQNEWPRGCVGVPVFYQLGVTAPPLGRHREILLHQKAVWV